MTFTPYTFAQRSGAWYLARVGRLTSSSAEAMLAKLAKGKGEAKTRAALRSRLVCERLTGRSEENAYGNAFMAHGDNYEAEALQRYEAETGEIVKRIGFLASDELLAGCSPDGYLGDYETIVEVKCPKATTHLAYIRRTDAPPEYVAQLRHLLWVSNATAIDFVSYCPWVPEHLSLYIKRVARRDLDLVDYDIKAREFLAEVDTEYRSIMSVQDALAESLELRKEQINAT